MNKFDYALRTSSRESELWWDDESSWKLDEDWTSTRAGPGGRGVGRERVWKPTVFFSFLVILYALYASPYIPRTPPLQRFHFNFRTRKYNRMRNFGPRRTALHLRTPDRFSDDAIRGNGFSDGPIRRKHLSCEWRRRKSRFLSQTPDSGGLWLLTVWKYKDSPKVTDFIKS